MAVRGVKPSENVHPLFFNDLPTLQVMSTYSDIFLYARLAVLRKSGARIVFHVHKDVSWQFYVSHAISQDEQNVRLLLTTQLLAVYTSLTTSFL